MGQLSDAIQSRQNDAVLKYLALGKRNTALFADRNSIPQPYYNCGCHPDIVERIWDGIGVALPTDCSGLVYGTPALVHPRSAVIFALGIGTQYGLLLPGGLAVEAVKAGAKLQTKWSSGGTMEIQRELGTDWVFGAWLANEPSWCRRVYELFDCTVDGK